MYTFWGVKKKDSKDEGVYIVLYNFQSGNRGDMDEVILHRLTQNMLTVTAANGDLERSLKKLKKASCWAARGAFKKGEKIKRLEVEVIKRGMGAGSTYARFIVGEVRIDGVRDVDATPGKGQDNFSVVTMTLKGKPESTHTNEYAKVQGERP